MQHALQGIARLLGTDEPIAWVVLTIVVYFIFGFGGYKFNWGAMRVIDKSTGRFVKWERALFFGIASNVCVFWLMHGSMSSADKYYWFLGLMMCITLSIILGRLTRK